ncbi:phosphatidylserine decarboxylase family protein [Arcticibacterium luteifluviistationis]|uniref:Phosphatidylserine decarboxylase proenzyme n=1 Tax=Arcticibacterium luteifluviistationis TaxID=1784714 RepID=A0A2Z4GE81_9BACT|nr:phosphatidylserine decarboxylase family protein [Arcticibacterium luteifluviistationis]AWV99556.1 phosphatidylserine decarboxylase family protein [Arcticibacterium luteifluviistationis]
MTLHKEGKATILISLFGTLAIYLIIRFLLPDTDWLHILWLAFSLFIMVTVLQFFRKPTRHTILNSNHIIAPADGKVVVIEEVVETEYFKGPRRQVSIFMSPINVHINFFPLSGVVSYCKYHAGKYLVAWHPKSSTENERSTVVVKHENGTEILFRQIAGAMARRIVTYAEEGQVATQGSEFGFIKFGSRVDIFLPLDAKILCKLDDKPVGGETVIAELA